MSNTDTLDELNEAVAQSGGNWYKLTSTDHPPIEGEIVAFEKRGKTFEGAPVMVRNSNPPKQRTEWVFTIKVDDLDPDIADDDGLRKVSLNESGQRAVATAIKTSGHQAVTGGRLKIGVKENGKTSTDQAEYQAKYSPPAVKVAIDEDEF